MKNFLTSVVILFIAFGIFYLIFNQKKIEQAIVPPPKPIQLCFYKEGPNKTPQGFYDISWLKMSLSGDRVTGEFRNYPAEKDSKVGSFEGTVSRVDPYMMARTANVWWDSLAEGMRVKEQLKIVFGEGTANAMFGEMMDRGDGIFIYKDMSKLTYSIGMNDVACADLDDRIIVEKYVRDNIKTLAPEKPVLGGMWYAMNIHIAPSTKTGTMEYEDGHVRGKATFSYTRIDQNVTISNVVKQ